MAKQQLHTGRTVRLTYASGYTTQVWIPESITSRFPKWNLDVALKIVTPLLPTMDDTLIEANLDVYSYGLIELPDRS